MRIVYVPGYNDHTDGSWAAGPLSVELKNKGVKVLNDPANIPNKVDYLAVQGGANIPAREDVTADGRDKLLARLKSLPNDVCIALIGYSSGVIAIQEALNVVPSSVGNRIVSVEMFANPRNVSLPHGVNAVYKGRIRYECNTTDPLCASPIPGTHTDKERKKCKEEMDRAKSGGLVGELARGAGPCFTPGHLTDAYGEAAKNSAVWAAGLVASSTSTESHTVAAGDTLSDLAAKTYGDGSKWQPIYDANRDAVEKAARDHGFASSDNGHWIFPGMPLTIPPAA